MTTAGDSIAVPPGRPLHGQPLPARMELELLDGYRTSMYVHAPRSDRAAGEARLPVLYVHGIQSHPGWFVGSAAHLAARGHAVYTVTRRGSGDNAVARGHAATAGQLFDDVQAACRFVREQTLAARLHLVGVSWGGKLLAAYVAAGAAGGEVASLVLVAPGIAPRVDLRPWTKLAVGASALFCPRREFDIPLSDPALFTDNEAMRQYIRQDPLSLRRATAGLLLASRNLDRLLCRAPAGAIRVPTTLLLASRDRIIDNAAARRVVEYLTAGRCTVKELPGAHTLEFESDPMPLYDALASALEG